MITRLDICKSCHYLGEVKTETSVWCKALGNNANCQLCTAFTTASSKASGGCPKGKWPDLPDQDPEYVPSFSKGKVLSLDMIPPERLETSDHCKHYLQVKGKTLAFCKLGVYASMNRGACNRCTKKET